MAPGGDAPATPAPASPLAPPPLRGDEATQGVTVVKTAEEAERVLGILLGLRDRYHAVDTETRGWEPGLPTYGHGEIICFSVYCGDDVDFGGGPRLFVDNLDEGGEQRGMVERFRRYLEDPGIRKVFHNYSFDRAMFFNEGVSVQGLAADTMHMARLYHSDLVQYTLQWLGQRLLGDAYRKGSLNDLMSGAGGESTEYLHLHERETWIDYSTFDTVATWKLHEELLAILKGMPWQGAEGGGTMLDFYEHYWVPFADVLVRIEERGVPFDLRILEAQTAKATRDLEETDRRIREWVRREYHKRYPGDPDLEGASEALNFGSKIQLRHLLFGRGTRKVGSVFIGGLALPESLASNCKKTAKTKEISVSAELLEELAGPDPESGPGGCGTALRHLDVEGCQGMAGLIRLGMIQKALTSFLVPLQDKVDVNGRVHTQLNLRTSTGRLSSQQPNLQQLPALDKDHYGIRGAVACLPDRRLIIADYGQLDLRVLAHMSGCAKMIEALNAGVDIHTATALYMYADVKDAVDRGEVALDKVKEVYASQRRHAKTVNFGIAYGLTKQGLARQLGCSEKEGEDMISRWYKAYPEVKSWQEDTVRAALQTKTLHVETLRGRWRRIPDLKLMVDAVESGPQRGGYNRVNWDALSARRKATNAPVQGGSADVVVEAMLRAEASEELRALGYRMILQIHDELVFEGPAENAAEALAAVREIMEHPFLDGRSLAVPLPVDASIAVNWMEGKGGGAAPPSSSGAAEPVAKSAGVAL